MKILSIFLYVGMLACGAIASSPNPTSYVVQGWDSECFLLMRPSFKNENFSGVATCYQIKEDGTLEKRWQIDESYSFEGRVFLGGAGSTLVRIVEVSQTKPDTEKVELAKQTVLEFYRDGKITKKIDVHEVVDVTKLEFSPNIAVLSTHKIFSADDSNTPKIGRISYFSDTLDESDRAELAKKSEDEDELFMIRTIQSEILVFKVADGSLIYRKKSK